VRGQGVEGAIEAIKFKLGSYSPGQDPIVQFIEEVLFRGPFFEGVDPTQHGVVNRWSQALAAPSQRAPHL